MRLGPNLEQLQGISYLDRERWRERLALLKLDLVYVLIKLNIKLGGLNSREQSISRFLNVPRVFENVKVFLDCQGFFLIKIEK